MRALSIIRRILVALVVVSGLTAGPIVSSVAGADVPTRQTSTAALIARTGQVTSFQQLQGRPAWRESALDRFAGASWGFSGGTFVYAPPNSRTDLFPLQGRYTVSGNVISFEASKSSRTGNTGSAYAEISGSVRVINGRLIVEANLISSSGNAAVVNGVPFSGANTTAYQARATLVQM